MKSRAPLNPIGLLVYGLLALLVCWCVGQLFIAPLILWLKGAM